MFLPFSDIVVSHRFDPELAALADRHYSRRTVGSPQFTPPGKQRVLRDPYGQWVFVWLHQRPEFRDDNQVGYCCSIFRNESNRLSSEIILQAEAFIAAEWGAARMFTYVRPTAVRSTNPGYCFKMAGWRNARDETGNIWTSKRGDHLLEKRAKDI